jgi:hypothetical protein
MTVMPPRWFVRRRLAFGALAAVIFLSGCLGSKNPITPLETGTIDERLFGAWVTTDLYYDETDYIHVMQQTDSGLMTIYEIRHYESHGGSQSSGQGHVSVLGDRRFLNLQRPPDADAPDDAPRYTFLAYDFDDRQLDRPLPLRKGHRRGVRRGAACWQGRDERRLRGDPCLRQFGAHRRLSRQYRYGNSV